MTGKQQLALDLFVFGKQGSLGRYKGGHENKMLRAASDGRRLFMWSFSTKSCFPWDCHELESHKVRGKSRSLQEVHSFTWLGYSEPWEGNNSASHNHDQENWEVYGWCTLHSSVALEMLMVLLQSSAIVGFWEGELLTVCLFSCSFLRWGTVLI